MELNYREYGEGSPIVILHGLFGSSDNWVTIGKKLAENYKVYLLDLRNHGASPWSDDWNYEVMSDDVYEFFQNKNIEDAIVIGHSMGGKTAMLFATNNYPVSISKLIIVDIAPKYYPRHHDTILNALLSMDLTSLQSRKEADEALQTEIPDFGTRQFLLKNLGRNKDNGFEWTVNLDIINQKIEEVGKALPTDSIFETPTLFIRGNKSDYIKDEDLVLIRQHFPVSVLKTIEGAGHWVHAEKPVEFLEIVNEFIG